ncbi:MAG: 8-amino-7-oxononanoate synthase [Acidiferrobacterales bacterium]
MTLTTKSLPDYLDRLKQKRLFRRRRVLESPQGVEVVIDGRPMLAFCSNDYLGLANHPLLRQAMIDGVNKYGVGAGASHLLSGHTAAHHALEEELAEFVGADKALLFSTGYMANQAVITSLVGRHDQVVEDRLNHASLIDAARLSRATVKRYPHVDVTKVGELVNSAVQTLVSTDAVFSMDGDLAPLPELVRVTRDKAWLLADDAHGIGVLGENGRGSFRHHGLGLELHTIYMGTLGKAMGSAGAFVAASSDLIETLIQAGRTYIYTTAMPPAVAEATRAAIRLLSSSTELQDKLASNVARFRRGASSLGLQMLDSTTAIQPILFGTSERAISASEALENEGILVPAIRPPTVPEGTARLRITLSAAHSEQHIDRLLEVLSKVEAGA